MNKPFTAFTLKNIPTESFVMTPLELKDYIDFEVKRTYFITSPVKPTSQHCHFVEKEFFVLIQGTCIAIIDKGQGKEEIPMVGPSDSTLCPKLCLAWI